MAAAPSKAQWRALRRHALAGDTDAAYNLLRQMLESYPANQEAADELARLEAGQPLHITESAEQRCARLCREAQHALLQAVTTHTQQTLACLPTPKLLHLQQELKAHLRAIRDNKSAAPNGTNAYKKKLERELGRRRKRSTRARLLMGAAVAAALLVLLTAAIFLQRRALRIEEQLQLSFTAAEWSHTDLLLKEADTGIHRLMNPRLGSLVQKVRHWQQAMNSLEAELNRHLTLYEQLNAVSTISLKERAEFLRQIHHLPAERMQSLLSRWEQLCRTEKDELDRQRAALLAEMKATEAAADATTHGSDLKQDTETHRRFISGANAQMTRFADATVALGLPPEPIDRVLQALKQAQLRLQELESLQRLDSLMSAARTLEQHAQALRTASLCPHLPTSYPSLEESLNLPGPELVAADLRAERHHLSPRLHPDVVRAIVDKGPTFTQAYPATPEQVHAMEDIFTSRPLNRRMYEITHPSGQAYFTDGHPEITEQGTVLFDISEHDPEHSIERTRRREWDNPQEVMIRPVDASLLLRAAGVARDTFFLSANVQEMLGAITSMQNKACPALAKAYLYHKLLHLLEQHRAPEIASMRFSPTLQADAAAFRRLEARLGIELGPECWLQRTEKVREAEALCEQWFAERKNRDYAGEMSKALLPILREQPHYLGYADLKQQPRYRQALAPDTPVRYYSGGKLVTAPAGKLSPAPTPFSPIIAE